MDIASLLKKHRNCGYCVVCLYHAERNHQGLDSRIIHAEEKVGIGDGFIKTRSRLGGFLNYYYREVAWNQALSLCGQIDCFALVRPWWSILCANAVLTTCHLGLPCCVIVTWHGWVGRSLRKSMLEYLPWLLPYWQKPTGWVLAQDEIHINSTLNPFDTPSSKNP